MWPFAPRKPRRKSASWPLRPRPCMEALEDRCLPSGPGSLDLTFAGTGAVTTSLSKSSDYAEMSLLQANGDIVTTGTTVSGPNNTHSFGLVAYTPSGSLDPAFGSSGEVIRPASVATNGPETAAQYASTDTTGNANKIVVAADSDSENGIVLARYNANGRLDTAFGNQGLVATAISEGYTSDVLAVAIQSDGKIVVGGDLEVQAGFAVPTEWLLLRYNPDGSPDKTFGNNGQLVTNPVRGDDIIYTVVVQPDGKILVGGQAGYNNGFAEFTLARYNSDSSLDSTFGSGGIVHTLWPEGYGTGVIRSLALQGDGKIVAVGLSTGPTSDFDGALARYNSDGSLDTTFGSGGLANAPVFIRGLASVALQSNGELAVAGLGRTANGDFSGVATFTAAGALDPTFGGSGYVLSTSNSATAAMEFRSLLVQPADGKIVITGWVPDSAKGGATDFAVARYLPSDLLTLSPTSLPVAKLGANYNQTLTASGGTAPYTFAGSAGSLPAWATLSADGILSGTPTAVGSSTFTVTATDPNGKTGSQTYTLTAEVPAASFRVSGFASPATAGVAGTFSVTALNADGTVDTGYAGTVHFTSSDPQAALPDDYTFTLADQGVHSLSATLKTAGTQVITATDAGDSSVVGAEPVAVVPAAADHWTFTQPPTDTVAGQTIDGDTVPAGVQVALFDKYNNLETGDSGDTTTLAIHTGPSSSLLGTPTQSLRGGVAVFGDLAIDTAGGYTLQATSATQSALPAVVSASFIISPAAPDHLTFTEQPTNTTAGQTINTGTTPAGVRVGLYDAFNNLETGDGSDPITVAVHSGPSNSLLGTLTQTASGGVALFADLSLDAAGSYTLQAGWLGLPALDPVPSAGFVINPAGFDHLAFAQQPTNTTAGQLIDAGTVPAGVRVGLYDAFNNLETGDGNDNVTLAVHSGPSSSLFGTLTQMVIGGVAVFGDVSLEAAGSYTLGATSPTRQTLTAAVSTSFMIGPAALDHLTFTQQPTSTIAGQAINAGTVPAGVRVGIFDRFNNPEAEDSSDAISVSVQSGPSGNLLGTLSQTASAGVAVFPDLSLETAGSYTLQAALAGRPAVAGTSANFVISPAALDRLTFIQQPADTAAGKAIDGGSVPAGVRVGLSDRFGNPEAGDSTDAVTLAVHSGPGDNLLGTLTQTASDGVAAFPDLSLETAGSYTLQAASPTRPGLAAVVSATFAIRPAAPDHLAFAQQPTDTTAGQTINRSSVPFGVRVRLYDAFNNLETDDIRDNVTLAIGSGPSTGLLGRLTEGASGGVAIFPDLSLGAAGNYTLQATCPTSPAVTVATSASFDLNPAEPDHLAFLQQPTDTTAGQVIDGTAAPAGVRVGLFDAFNNPEAQDGSDAVTLSVYSGPSSSLLGTPTQTAGVGVAVFGDLSLDTAGSYTLQATSPTQPGMHAVLSISFTITAGPLDHLAFTQQPTDTTAGQTINAGGAPAGVRVGLFDRFNNPEAQDSTDAVALAVQPGPGGSLLGTLTQTAGGGVAVFSGLSLEAAGSYTLQASSPSRPAVAAVVSAGFAVRPAAPDHLAFGQQPTDTTAGQEIGAGAAPAGVRVGLFDRFNNLEAQDGSDAVTLAVQSGPSGILLGKPTQTASNGVAVFGDLSLDTAGSYTLQASSPTRPGLPAVGSLSFAITATVPDHLAFAQQPTDTTAGQMIDGSLAPAGVRVGLFDRFNNPEVSDSTDTVTFAIQSGPSGNLLGTLTQTASGGVVDFPDLALDVAGSYTLQATTLTQPALGPVVSTVFAISAAAPDHLAFAQQPTDTAAGQVIDGSLPAGVQVRLLDAFNNAEIGDNNDSVTLAVGSGPSSSFLGTPTQTVSRGVADFPNLSLDIAGSYTLQATSRTRPGVAAGTSVNFIIRPAAPDHLTFVQQPTDTTAGQAIDGSSVPAGVRVGLFDAFGNPEAGDNVTLAVRSGPGGSLLGRLTQTVAGGVAVFPDLSLDIAGSYTVQAASPSQPALAALTSAGFVIRPAAADHLAFVQQPTDTPAGAPISPAVTVQVLDPFNNPTTTTAGVTLSLGGGPGGASLGGPHTRPAGGGPATFNNLSITLAGNDYTLAATSPGLSGVASAAFAVTPTAAYQLAFSPPSADATPGQTVTGSASPLVSMLFGPIIKLRVSRHHLVPGRYLQEVSLFNTTGQPVAGPFTLLLGGLSARLVVRHHQLVMRSTHIRLLDASGFAQGLPAPDSPYLFDELNVQQLDSVQGATFVLNFSDPLNRPILYTPLLTAGEVP